MLLPNQEENHSQYLSMIDRVANGFITESQTMTELVVALTENDFNQKQSASIHKDDKYLARIYLVLGERNIVALFDFKNNVQLTIAMNDTIKISEIGENMIKHFKDCYGFSYNELGEPIFQPAAF